MMKPPCPQNADLDVAAGPADRADPVALRQELPVAHPQADPMALVDRRKAPAMHQEYIPTAHRKAVAPAARADSAHPKAHPLNL